MSYFCIHSRSVCVCVCVCVCVLACPSIEAIQFVFLHSIGPALSENRVRVTGAATTTVLLEWELRQNSLPASGYRLRFAEVLESGEVSPSFSLPFDLTSTQTSQQFINLVSGTTFQFSIEARGTDSSFSPPVVERFFVGPITRKLSKKVLYAVTSYALLTVLL